MFLVSVLWCTFSLVEGFKEFIYNGLSFYVFNGVYEPSEDALLLADNLEVYESDIVLDMGTGCGIIAILSALRASYVVAIDINPRAVECAKKNARRNGVLNKIDFICGNLFDPLKRGAPFTLVLFNPPYLPCNEEPKERIEHAWAGGVNGRSVIDKFIVDLPKYLDHGGKLLMVQSSLSDLEKTITLLRGIGFQVKLVKEVELFFETIALIKAIKV